jgi:hypothetical protein
MNADQGWSSITRCAQEDSERARHTCMDGVLRETGVLTNEMHTRQQRRAFGLDDKSAPPQPALRPSPPPPAATATPPATAAIPPTANAEALNRRAAGMTPGGASAATGTATSRATASPVTAAPSPATTASPAQPDRLEAELAKVEKAANGRVFVTTTDGAVWLQTETVDMPQPPVPGDHMSIRKGSMGGYRCSVASTHLTYRCARNR